MSTSENSEEEAGKNNGLCNDYCDTNNREKRRENQPTKLQNTYPASRMKKKKKKKSSEKEEDQKNPNVTNCGLCNRIEGN